MDGYGSRKTSRVCYSHLILVIEENAKISVWLLGTLPLVDQGKLFKKDFNICRWSLQLRNLCNDGMRRDFNKYWIGVRLETIRVQNKKKIYLLPKPNSFLRKCDMHLYPCNMPGPGFVHSVLGCLKSHIGCLKAQKNVETATKMHFFTSLNAALLAMC